MIDIIKIKIRGYHIDSYGHVNNTRYLEFLEEARWVLKDKYFHFFEKHQDKYGLVVVNNNIDYHAPLFINDTIRIESSVQRIGNKSVVFIHNIISDKNNHQIAHAKATFVFFNRNTNLSESIPLDLRKNFIILLNNEE